MTGTPVGSVGRVSIRIRGGDAAGEAVVPVDGIRETWVAYATEPLEVGRQVLVVGVRAGRGVDVVAWDVAGPGWAAPSSASDFPR
jgi:hypothetical protein